MARIWKEANDGRRYGDTPREPVPRPARNLVKQEFVCVKVCSFTFRFVTKDEIVEYISLFEKKTHPSSRVPTSALPDCNFRHWHSQRWYERFPPFPARGTEAGKGIEGSQGGPHDGRGRQTVTTSLP